MADLQQDLTQNVHVKLDEDTPINHIILADDLVILSESGAELSKPFMVMFNILVRILNPWQSRLPLHFLRYFLIIG